MRSNHRRHAPRESRLATRAISQSHLTPALLLLLTAACGGKATPPDLCAELATISAPETSGASRGVPFQLSAGGDYTCVVFSNWPVSCWGDPTGTATCAHPTPVYVPAVASRAAAEGIDVQCFYSAVQGRVECRGDDTFGAVGDGRSGEGVVTPALTMTVPGGSKSISLGHEFGCSLDMEGNVYCWGDNRAGQAGTGGGAQVQAAPQQLPTLSGIRMIATGASHACALSVDHENVNCWGQDLYGQLGDGLSGAGHDRSAPSVVDGLPSGFASVAAGGGVTCVITAAGDVWCWGSNANAQLGTGAPGSPVTTPTQVAGISGVSVMAIGDTAACAITTAGTTYCWGVDLGAANGPDAGVTYLPPTVVTGIPTAAQIALGSDHACVLGVDGTVWCWGANDGGQCGPLATGSVVATPVQVPL